MDEIYLSVVIPAYNEGEGLGSALLAFDKYLSQQKYSYEIIVYNDGSSDGTAAVVKRFVQLVRNLRLIDNKQNHGKGYAVKKGMLMARGKYRLFTDADNSTSIEHLDKVWEHFEKGAEIVIGSRDSKDAKGASQAVPQPFAKRLMGNLGNVLIQLLAVWGIWDTQCGFKIMTKEAAEDILTRCLVDRWSLDIEILAIAKRLGYKIGIIPVHWVNRTDSRVGIKGYIRTFWDLFKIKYNLIIDKYHLKK